MHIMFCIFGKNENFEKHIEKFKWKSTRAIWSEKFKAFKRVILFLRNDQKCWFGAFFSSQFPDIVCHKARSITLKKYPGKLYAVLKIWDYRIFCHFLLSVSLVMTLSNKPKKLIYASYYRQSSSKYHKILINLTI